MSTITRLRDERGVIGVSLIRWTIVLVLLGLVAIEGGSIIFTTIGLQSAADGAAAEAADVWEKTGNLGSAGDAASRELENREQDQARLVHIEADNTAPFEVRITVRKQAATLLVHRIGFLEDFATVEVEAEHRSSE